MLLFILIATIGNLPNQSQYDSNDIQLLVEINSSIYSYHVKNISQTKITSIVFPQHATYNFINPEGWEETYSSTDVTTHCNNIKDAISYKQTKTFSMRVSSRGATLGERPVKITLNNGKIIIFQDVWASVPEKKTYLIWILISTLFIITIHFYRISKKTNI